MPYNFFTRKIRALRTEAGYTQEYVSHYLNIQRQTYSNYENGTRTPSLETVVSLARLYHISVDALLLEQPPSSYPPPRVLSSEFSTLSPPQQKAVLQFIQLIKRTRD